MTEWKDIHPDLTNKLQREWYKRKFTPEQTQEWINTGLKPTDYQFATYLRDIISCSPEEVLDFGDLETLKEQHQEYLKFQEANSETDEAQTLAEAIRLSLGIFSPDDLLSKSKLSDQELEKYLSEKRLDLKKYFVFSLGKEVKITPKITVSDESGEIVSEPIPNIRQVKPLLTEHLTQLFKDGYEKSAISFTGKNTNQPSPEWSGDRLDHKIRNGEEVYIVFDKSRIETNSSYVRSKAVSATQLGDLEWSEIIVLAVEVAPQVRVFQSKKNILKFLRENEFKCKAVSCSEEIIGEQDYCLYHQTCLAKLEEKQEIPNIQEIDTFETWFNGNCGYVINKDNIPNVKHPFRFWLIIYEPEYKSGKVEEYWAIMNVWNYERFTRAQREAHEIKNKLCDDNPLTNPFAIHWKADKYTTFVDLIGEPYVRRIEVPCDTEETERTWDDFCGDDTLARASLLEKDVNIFEKIKIPVANKNPSDYLKPLDVVWVGKSSWGVSFYHVGIYLGDNQICHFSSESGKREDNKTIITDWETFVEGCIQGEIFAYHPALPFKHYELIARQIDWAEANNYDEGWYCLPNNNCEHHANSFVFGIDYSKQVKEREPLFWPRRCKMCDSCRCEIINNGKGSTVKLTNEIKETNSELKKSHGEWCKQIKVEYEAKTVVPLKDCRLM